MVVPLFKTTCQASWMVRAIMFSWTKILPFLARLGNTLLDLVEKAQWKKTNESRQEEIDKIDDWVNSRLTNADKPVMRLRAKIKDKSTD